MSALFRGTALRVRQPIGDFWVVSIPARVLLIATAPDTLRIAFDPKFHSNKGEWERAIKLLGNQRPIHKERLEEVAKYIDGREATFPNSIIIAANSANEDDGDATEDKQPWRLVQKGSEYQLVIPENPKLASVVDGQHRLYAFLKSTIPERQEFELLCSVFIDMPQPVQAMVFATINTNQKPVRRGLALNLYGYNVEDEDRTYWNPEKLAVFLTRRLNFDPDSPVHNRIRIEAKNAPEPLLLEGATRAIPMAAVVDGMLRLITTDHVRDRNDLTTERVFRRNRREDLRTDPSALRTWYRIENDALIYSAVVIFMRQVANEVWNAGARNSMLTRAVGIRALFGLLSELAKAGTPKEGLPVSGSASAEYLRRLERSAQRALSRAARIDFSDSHFEASGRGQRRIELALLISAGLRTLGDATSDERDQLQRLLSAQT